MGVAEADVMRPYNLDYLDVETMKYYLEPDPHRPTHDYDVAVLYYAQWDSNSHAFAPIWDKIGRLLHAGSKEANLIMGLFDCETNQEHMQVCDQAHVKHYPTVKFYSLSGKLFFHGKQRKTKKNPIPRHGTDFLGNWQYGDAVFDWIRTMTTMSRWHRSGWRQKLLSLFQGGKHKTPLLKDQPLPLGVPRQGTATAATTPGSSPFTTTSMDASAFTGAASSSSSSSSATDSSSPTFSAAQVLDLQNQYEEVISSLEAIAIRSSHMVDALLHPVTVHNSVSTRVGENSSLVTVTLRHEDTGKNYTDAFWFMTETNAWHSNRTTQPASSHAFAPSAPPPAVDKDTLIQNDDFVLRSCLMELSLDYCSRFSDKLALDWLDRLDNTIIDQWTADLVNSTALEAEFLQLLEEQEPYCVVLESCLTLNMEPAECRPPTCPFVDPTACRYLSSCFHPDVQRHYAKTLQVNTTLSTSASSSSSSFAATDTSVPVTDASASSDTKAAKDKRGWGLF